MEYFFWNTENQTKTKNVYVLFIYDIVNNKRRTKLAKCLQGYGFRVQKSAFEAMISERLYKKLIDEIPQMIDKEEDSVRIYRIIGKGEVQMFGKTDDVKWEDVIII